MGRILKGRWHKLLPCGGGETNGAIVIGVAVVCAGHNHMEFVGRAKIGAVVVGVKLVVGIYGNAVGVAQPLGVFFHGTAVGAEAQDARLIRLQLGAVIRAQNLAVVRLRPHAHITPTFRIKNDGVRAVHKGIATGQACDERSKHPIF